MEKPLTDAGTEGVLTQRPLSCSTQPTADIVRRSVYDATVTTFFYPCFSWTKQNPYHDQVRFKRRAQLPHHIELERVLEFKQVGHDYSVPRVGLLTWVLQQIIPRCFAPSGLIPVRNVIVKR